MPWNFNTIDLSDWKINLPVDSDYVDGNGNDPLDGTSVELVGDEWEGYEDGEFVYYDQSAGGIVFSTPVVGATTGGSGYTRTELREMDETGEDEIAWEIEDGGTLSATLKLTEIAQEDDGDPARVIVGQIHGEDDELARLYVDSSGLVYFANEITGSDGEERFFKMVNADGELADISVGETFSYIIDVVDDRLIVQVYADGEVYSAGNIAYDFDTNAGDTNYLVDDGTRLDPTVIADDWFDDTFYFKAGVYQGVNQNDGHFAEGSGQTTAIFYDIDVSHVEGEGRDAWLGEGTGGPPNPPSTGETFEGTGSADTYTGTSGDDTINGNGGGDDLRGGGGDDDISGGGGWDEIRGGSGDDELRGNAGNDLVKGEDGDDEIHGGSGSDELWGNAGDDVIYAGRGADWLKGGNGADTYVFQYLDGVDTIADFSTSNGDQIDLQMILDDATGLNSSNALSDGYIDLRQTGDDTRVYIDLDGEGSGAAVHALTLLDETASGLGLDDFIIA